MTKTLKVLLVLLTVLCLVVFVAVLMFASDEVVSIVVPSVLVFMVISLIIISIYESGLVVTKAIVVEKHPVFGGLYWVTFTFDGNKTDKFVVSEDDYNLLEVGKEVLLTHKRREIYTRKVVTYTQNKS